MKIVITIIIKIIMKQLDKLVNKQRLFRRLVLLWAMCLISYFVFFLMDHQFLINVSPAGATIATGVIAILSTVIAFYQWHRSKDDEIESKTLLERDSKTLD